MSSTANVRIDRNAAAMHRTRRNWQRLAQATANPLISVNPSSTNAFHNTATGYGVFVDGVTITINSTGAIQGASIVIAGDGSISTSTGGGSTAISVVHNSTAGTSTSPSGIGIKLAPSSALSTGSAGLTVLVDGTTIGKNSTNQLTVLSAGLSNVFALNDSISTSTGGGSTGIAVHEDPLGAIVTNVGKGIAVQRKYITGPAATVLVGATISTSTTALASTGAWAVAWQLGSTNATASTNALVAEVTANTSSPKLVLYQGATVLASTATFPLTVSTRHTLLLSTNGAKALVQVDGSTVLLETAYTSTTDAQAGFYAYYNGTDPHNWWMTDWGVSTNGSPLFTDTFPNGYIVNSTLSQNNSQYTLTYLSTGTLSPNPKAFSLTQTTDKTNIETQGLKFFVNSAGIQTVRYNSTLPTIVIYPDSGLAVDATTNGLYVNTDNSTCFVDSTFNAVHVGVDGVNRLQAIGDIPIIGSTSTLLRFPIGTQGQVLVVNSTSATSTSWSTLTSQSVLPGFAAAPSTDGQALYRTDLLAPQIQVKGNVENFARSQNTISTSTLYGNSTGLSTILSTVLPAGYLIQGKMVRLTAWGRWTLSTGAATNGVWGIRVRPGVTSTTFTINSTAINVNNTNQPWYLECVLTSRGSTSSANWHQAGKYQSAQSGGTNIFNLQNAGPLVGVDATAQQTVELWVSTNSANFSTTVEQGTIEFL